MNYNEIGFMLDVVDPRERCPAEAAGDQRPLGSLPCAPGTVGGLRGDRSRGRS